MGAMINQCAPGARQRQLPTTNYQLSTHAAHYRCRPALRKRLRRGGFWLYLARFPG